MDFKYALKAFAEAWASASLHHRYKVTISLQLSNQHLIIPSHGIIFL
jgi:hypothetical protein